MCIQEASAVLFAEWSTREERRRGVPRKYEETSPVRRVGILKALECRQRESVSLRSVVNAAAKMHAALRELAPVKCRSPPLHPRCAAENSKVRSRQSEHGFIPGAGEGRVFDFASNNAYALHVRLAKRQPRVTPFGQ